MESAHVQRWNCRGGSLDEVAEAMARRTRKLWVMAVLLVIIVGIGWMWGLKGQVR